MDNLENIVKKDKITVDNFVSLFCALNLNSNINSFNKHELLNFIFISKFNNEFVNILDNISIVNIDQSYYSDEVLKSIKKLQLKRLIYFDEKDRNLIYISSRLPISMIIGYNIKYINDMTKFINKYNEYILKEKQELEDKKNRKSTRF